MADALRQPEGGHGSGRLPTTNDTTRQTNPTQTSTQPILTPTTGPGKEPDTPVADALRQPEGGHGSGRLPTTNDTTRQTNPTQTPTKPILTSTTAPGKEPDAPVADALREPEGGHGSGRLPTTNDTARQTSPRQ